MFYKQALLRIEGQMGYLFFGKIVYAYLVPADDLVKDRFKHLVDENVDRPEEHHEDQMKL